MPAPMVPRPTTPMVLNVRGAASGALLVMARIIPRPSCPLAPGSLAGNQRDPHRLGPARLPAYDADRGPGHAQRPGQEAHQLVVRPAVDRRRRQPDLQLLAVLP